MKNILLVIFAACLTIVAKSQGLAGAWELKMGQTENVILATENYLTYTTFDSKAQTFTQTWGGTYKLVDAEAVLNVEFNSSDPEEVGKQKVIKIRLVGNEFLKIGMANFRKRDNSTETPLAAAWQISQRATPTGEMQSIEPGARKTLKVLTGSRFQWIAMNTETGEFSGTGGGTYSLENGIYTEKIEFFSKDGSRVGASLSFNAEVDTKDWQHSGKSSKGQEIREVWSKVE